MKILITGANGNIGKKLQAHFEGWDESHEIVCVDRKPATAGGSGDGNFKRLDLSQWSQEIVDLLKGVDVVVHLAADPNENKSWDELQGSNLDASFNLFVAAIQAKVPRVIFASSNHAMGGYRTERGVGRWLTPDLPAKPGTKLVNYDGSITDSTAYGAMKFAVERMGSTYAAAADAVCIAIRIGWVNPLGQNRVEDLPEHADVWFKQMWLSDRDLGQLIEKAVTADLKSGYYVVNGMSNNEDMVWNILSAEELLGYRPVDTRKS